MKRIPHPTVSNLLLGFAVSAFQAVAFVLCLIMLAAFLATAVDRSQAGLRFTVTGTVKEMFGGFKATHVEVPEK